VKLRTLNRTLSGASRGTPQSVKNSHSISGLKRQLFRKNDIQNGQRPKYGMINRIRGAAISDSQPVTQPAKPARRRSGSQGRLHGLYDLCTDTLEAKTRLSQHSTFVSNPPRPCRIRAELCQLTA